MVRVVDSRKTGAGLSDDGHVDELLPIAGWQRWWCAARERDPLAEMASRHGFVLTSAQLAELDVTRAHRRWAVDRGRWTRAGRGLVAPVDVRIDLPDHGTEHVAARRRHALVAAGAVVARRADAVSARSAAILHGLPTLGVPPLPEITARSPGHMGPRPANHLLAGMLDDWQLTSWYGIDVADVARTLVDLARRNRRDAIMAVDAALREHLVTVEQIDRALRLARRWPGIRQARSVLALGDGRAESPLESITRLAIHDAGLPAPELQFWIGSDRVDFFWPRFRFVLEADGRVKYTAEERWAEKTREQRLRRHRVRVERVTWADVTLRWSQTCRLLDSELR